MDIVLFCQAVGWTYEQYLAQPTWFVERLRIKIEEDAAQAKRQK